jgi:hypothetical protein
VSGQRIASRVLIAVSRRNEFRAALPPHMARIQESCELFGNDGNDSSIVTQGNLSSSQIAFCGANGAGSSSDAIVTSIVSESLLSSKNK